MRIVAFFLVLLHLSNRNARCYPTKIDRDRSTEKIESIKSQSRPSPAIDDEFLDAESITISERLSKIESTNRSNVDFLISQSTSRASPTKKQSESAAPQNGVVLYNGGEKFDRAKDNSAIQDWVVIAAVCGTVGVLCAAILTVVGFVCVKKKRRMKKRRKIMSQESFSDSSVSATYEAQARREKPLDKIVLQSADNSIGVAIDNCPQTSTMLPSTDSKISQVSSVSLGNKSLSASQCPTVTITPLDIIVDGYAKGSKPTSVSSMDDGRKK